VEGGNEHASKGEVLGLGIARSEVVSSKVPWADAADIGGGGLRMRAACGWCCGWCDCPAGMRVAGAEGRAMPKRYSSTDSLAGILPSRKGCSRVPLRSKLQEKQSSEVSV